MSARLKLIGAGTGVCAVTAALALGSPATAAPRPSSPPAAARHVLLLSVDGLHQSDLAWYVRTHPRSALAALVHNGINYTHAKTTFPSDSFPGMIAQLTGGGAGVEGVYYDDTFNRTLLPAGTTSCTGVTPGTEVAWTEGADKSQNPIALDAGQHLADPALTALQTNTAAQTEAAHAAITKAILKLTPHPQTLLDPAALPVDPRTCTPVYPHQYIRTNTVFDVVKAAGLRTAWSDKHPAYEILNGPSGKGIDDLFTPEINSVADSAGQDWTNDNALTQEYDGFKVAAVVNEINGYDHSGTHRVGTPAIFGMNFQTVSTAQKLPTSDGLTGGYRADGTPGPLLARALNFVNAQVARFDSALRTRHLLSNTTIILSAKHGQSPIDKNKLRRVDDGPIIDAINAAWAGTHPGNTHLVTFAVDDDGLLFWLSDRSAGAQAFVKNYLLTHSAPANTINDPKGVYSTSVPSSGVTAVYTGGAADAFVGAPTGDSHAPDLIGIGQVGVVYTGGVKKIAEHGGDAAADRDVALVVSGAGVPAHRTVTKRVQTTQIAPTILTLLGLNPGRLEAVQIAHTRALPKK